MSFALRGVVRGGCRRPRVALGIALATLATTPATAAADVVVPDDQIVQGSQCVGFDCVNNENFGFSSLVLKENNTRMLFNDTSVAPNPMTNWALIANDPAGGVGEYFGLMDLGDDGTNTTGPGDYPFKVAADAGNDALSVDTDGDVGIGTADAARDLQLTRTDTPTVRLEQTNGGGFTAQTWDVAGNEANFFVRDFTNGSLLPFRIRPGAPTSSVDIAANGNVGIGISNPSAPLDVQRGNGNAKVEVTETNATTQLRRLIELANNGPTAISYSNSGPGTHPTWLAGTGGSSGDDYLLDTQGSAVPALRASAAGDVTSGGALLQNASPGQKADVQQVDPVQVLSQVASLPLQTWTYAGSDGGRHIGPAADAFRGASGLGPASDAVAPGDVGGVALAGVQALKEQVDGITGGGSQAKRNKKFKKQIAKLKKQNKKLNKRLTKLERTVGKG